MIAKARYARYSESKKIPSFLLISFFLEQRITNMIVVPNKIAISVKITLETGACPMSETEPKMREIFMMFEPTTFPRARSFSPFFAATMLVTSSGKLVPTATIVRPTKASLMPI